MSYLDFIIENPKLLPETVESFFDKLPVECRRWLTFEYSKKHADKALLDAEKNSYDHFLEY